MSETRPTIVGSYLSPYVRKVLVCLHLKGLDYAIDPIVPFFGNEAFSKLNPVRRIPVLIEGDLVVSDSTVICEYLEDAHPGTRRLLPDSAGDRARARWIEEYVDTRMGDVVIWRLFNQRVINPHVWSIPTDEGVVEQALAVEIPEMLDWLEPQAPETGYLFGALSVADVALGAMLRNAAFAGYSVDVKRWPRLAGLLSRLYEEAAFASLTPFENLLLRTRIPEQRAALAAAGAPLTETTFGTARPVRGVMSV
jgi:glutathione S-transferase